MAFCVAAVVLIFTLTYVSCDIIVTFSGKKSATYRLEKLNEDDAWRLEGGQAYIRFATVVKSGEQFMFKRKAKVALKIAKLGMEPQLRNEAGALAYIKSKYGQLDGIVGSEEGVGELQMTLGLLGESNLHITLGELSSRWYLIVLQRLGPNALDFKIDQRFYSTVVRSFYNQIQETLTKLHMIGVEHRDLKPGNILTNADNNPPGNLSTPPQFIISDFGLTKWPLQTEKHLGSALDYMYFSLGLTLPERNPTPSDEKESSFYTTLMFACRTLPWTQLVDDLSDTGSDRNYLKMKIWIMKYEFTFQKYSEAFLLIDEDLKNDMTALLTKVRATEAERNNQKYIEISNIVQSKERLLAAKLTNNSESIMSTAEVQPA